MYGVKGRILIRTLKRLPIYENNHRSLTDPFFYSESYINLLKLLANEAFEKLKTHKLV